MEASTQVTGNPTTQPSETVGPNRNFPPTPGPLRRTEAIVERAKPTEYEGRSVPCHDNGSLLFLTVVAGHLLKPRLPGMMAGACQPSSVLANWMKFKKLLVFSLFAVVFLMNSCSGVIGSTGFGTSNGPSGNIPLVLTLRAIPLTPPPNTNILSFSVTVVGVSMTRSTGPSVSVLLNSNLYQVDLTRLQSDSAFLGSSAAIPADTYTKMVVSLSNPVVTYCTQTQGITGCAPGSVTTLTGGPAAPVIATTPFPLTLAAGQTTGLVVNFDLGKALSVNPQTQVITNVNLGAANVLSATVLPPVASNLPPSALDFVGDVTGVITSVNVPAQNVPAQTVVVQTATQGSITAIASNSTIVSPNCTTFNLGSTLTCVKQGQVASLDMTLNADGTFSLVEYDPLAINTGDWIEGIVGLPPSSSTQFQMVTNDVVIAPSNSLIGQNLSLSAPVIVTLVNPQPFVVDTKGLTVPTTPFTGSSATSVLLPGVTVSVHVTAFTPASSTAPAAANVDFVYLRFTRVTGTVANPAPPNAFAMQSFPSFLGLTVPVTVQLSTDSPSTSFEGISSASGFVVGQPASIRALYFGPPTGPTPTPTPFSATEVRVP